MTSLFPLAVTWLRDRRRFVLFGRSRSVTDAERRKRARYLLSTLVDLGPTFIKFGQMLSTRPDAIPEAYVEVLSELQDEVPPEDWSEIEPVIERELGPVADRFDDFDTEPISGASLGQVYTASVSGRDVAVKVLRPNIRGLVEADVRVIATLLPVLVRFAPESQSFTLENLAEEFAVTIREEMDYGHEAAMLEEIGKNFDDDPGVTIPEVVATHSTDRILTMTYVEGTKITDVDAIDAMGIDREDLVQRLEEAYIQMIVEDGVFHADPHPGNLAVQSDGTIVFYDFGMTGRVGPSTRSNMLDFYVAVATDDVDAALDAFVAMGALDPDADRTMMRQVFSLVLDSFRGQDVEQYRVEELFGEFQSELYDFPMRLPQDLAHVVRVTSVLEGVCRTLDPEFDFIDVITDYVRSRRDVGGEEEAVTEQVARRLAERARESASSAIRVPTKLDRGLSVLSEGDGSVQAQFHDETGLLGTLAWRLVLGVGLAAAIPLASLLYAVGVETVALVVAAATIPLSGLLVLSFRTRRRRTVEAMGDVARRSVQNRRRGE
ncbi:AarF/ABC1/UbiB kinase family protein [Haloarculaceae archaeon H-GB11]|nr:AarF/ABC1/UbiB kinase family protein [Haloarculaceae archaeon H-GB11]